MSEILSGSSLSDAAKEKYLPYMAVRVNHDFSKVLNGRFWRNLGISEGTREKEREERRKLREVGAQRVGKEGGVRGRGDC